MGLSCSPYSELVTGWLKMVLVAHLGVLLATLLSHGALACGLGKVTIVWVTLCRTSGHCTEKDIPQSKLSSASTRGSGRRARRCQDQRAKRKNPGKSRLPDTKPSCHEYERVSGGQHTMEEPNLPSHLDAGLKSISTAGGEGPTMERASTLRGRLTLFVLWSLLGRTSRAHKGQLSSAGPGGPSLCSEFPGWQAFLEAMLLIHLKCKPPFVPHK